MEKIDQWFSDKAESIGLQVRVFKNELLDKNRISDIDCKIAIEGREYWGRGTARDIDLALRKSCCEAVERYFLHQEKSRTSNGYAVHQSTKLAVETTVYELIERDLFMCHFLTKAPFKKIEVDVPWIEEICKGLAVSGIEVNFYMMGKINFIEGVLCVIMGKNAVEPFGCILGTSAGESWRIIESAFLEALRNLAHLDRKSSLSLDQFSLKSMENVSFMDHGNLALNLNYAEKALYPLLESRAGVSAQEGFNLNLKTHTFNLENTPFLGAPFFVCKTASDALQDLYVGKNNLSNLNTERIKKFCAAYSVPYEISEFPHPFN